MKMLKDGQMTDAGGTGILFAYPGAFGSGELKIVYWYAKLFTVDQIPLYSIQRMIYE